MMTARKIENAAQLAAYRVALQRAHDPQQRCLTLCGGTGCRAYGAERVLASAKEHANGDVQVRMTGCHGFCEKGPIVVIQPAGIFYQRVQPKDIDSIVHETIAHDHIIERLLYTDPATGGKIEREHDVPFYARQTRLLLNQNGLLDPTNIDEYIALGGYASLAQALMDDGENIIEQITRSGLRGRGGAGFPTGVKWRTMRDGIRNRKVEIGNWKIQPPTSNFQFLTSNFQPPTSNRGYIICNADEGDPGAYMDRSLMEGNPHRIIEGMIIGAYAVGATRGYVYIRTEYPLAVKHLRGALQQARAWGLLGKNILGSGFDFDIEVRLGAGAFVCGEETALMASIEGRTGEPRPRPPYPAQRGLWGKPTIINNVKTWASAPLILERGADWYANIGTAKSKGTMIFSLVGKVMNTGLVEVPMGITLRELIFGIGGGIPNGKEFKAAQIGGPSGGCLAAEHLDTPIDYESLSSLGAIVGSGGLVVADEDTCMVDLARYFMNFVQEESCGKCTPCRVGTKAMLDILTRITQGRGEDGDLERLEELARAVKDSSLCGLGQTAPNPVLTTLRYFREEYREHIYAGQCRARVCKGLIRYEIIPELCTGCLVCLRNCAQKAITGEKLKPHVIDDALCGKCGVCQALCRFDAVKIVTGVPVAALAV
ncbi:MAG: NADH-quinone oxidoreductase subunit NuoF [Chloroflexi bacterium]|nr:NADH-quinone oxidoreductase subunit NuoF [Chloroflexota bacterium]